MERMHSRRQVLTLLVAAGGALLTAACGGVVSPVPATARLSERGATATPAPTAPTAAATPPSAASPTGVPGRFLSAGTALGRMLATLPREAAVRAGAPALVFADIGRQLRNYGFAGTTSYTMLEPADKHARFMDAIARALPIPYEAGLENLGPATGEATWRDVVGYDFWQVDRALAQEQSDDAEFVVRLEGRFDQEAIARALAAAGRAATRYREGVIHTYGGDHTVDARDVLFQRLGLLGSFTHAVLAAAALADFRVMRLAESAIDVQAGRAPALVADPDYDAVAVALDPVVGAALVHGDEYYGRVNRRGTPVAPASPPVGAERLPPYRLAGLGLQDDGAAHTMVVALVYEQAGDARAAAPLLRRRAEAYALADGTPLRDRAVAGEPRLVAAGSRTAVLLPLAIQREADLGLWRQMRHNGDYLFLGEY